MPNYINYHSHSQFSNAMTPDVTITNRDRAARAKELDMPVASFTEHGWVGRFIEGIELSKEFNIKPLLGTEAYFVKDRLEKDATNVHLIILAKNETGRKAINKALSEANISGFYYRPRLDMSLVLSLPQDDVWVTTACIGGIWKYSDYEDILKTLHDHFQDNFFLEVQYHHVSSQMELNKRILELSNKYKIKIIAGMDSHMISLDQKKERDDYLLSRGIQYPDEENWFLDFPSYETAYQRFQEQDVLSNQQIEEALNNTNIFQEVEEYNSIIFNKDIVKLPSLYFNETQKQKDQRLTQLVWDNWNIEKSNVPQKKWKHYEDEIQKELDVIIKTSMADYFLLDYEIIKRGKEKDGSITLTGRGSAPSYYISKLLGFTTIDRISAKVKLFPERFISAERIIQSKNLPDVDMNLGTPEIFAEAQHEIMGDGHSYQMLAFGTVKTLGAWKLYARTAGVEFETANLISEQISKYEFDLKHTETEEDKESKSIYDYIDSKYHQVYDESTKYLGLVNTLNPHPCAYLIFNHGDIREEFGLVKIKTGGAEHLCACCDGLFAENYKLLKNDLLKVSVVDLIYRTYKRIEIQPHPLPELIKLCENDGDVWNIYKNGWTIGINQFEQSSTAARGSKYAPKNLSETSAFVASIRPGFKSNYAQFEAREPFSYGIPSLDKLLQTDEFPQSYMLYQEQTMAVLAYSGIPISETYDIIKNIAKKRAEKVFKYKEKFLDGMTKKIVKQEGRSKEEAEKIAHMTWQVIEDSSKYSFNASHAYSVAGDSLYGAYLKSHYPLFFYETFLQMMEEDGDKDRLLLAKLEAGKAFGIKFPKAQFGQDNRKIVANPDTNEITTSLKSIKGFGSKTAEDMYYLSSIYQGNDFLELLLVAEDNGILSSKFEQLIKLGYFDQFGGNKKLHKFYLEFTKGKNRYNKTLTQKSKDKRLPELQTTFAFMNDEKFSIQEQIQNELEIVNGVQSRFGVDVKYLCVLEIDEKYAPMILVQVLKSGLQEKLKVSKKNLREHPFNIGDVLICKEISHPFGKKKNTEGEWVDNPEKQYIQLDCYYVMKPEDEFYKDIKNRVLYDQFAN
jgi:DNA polymerase III alpha subunit